PILVLIPLAIVLAVRFPDPARPALSACRQYGLLLLAGTLLGMSMGLKLTNCMFVLGLAVAWLWRFNFSVRYFGGGIMAGLGIILGFLIVDGWWAWRLWTEFQNPLFPFYNEIFKSPMIKHIFTNTPAWAAADDMWEVLVYPFRWVLGIPPN